MAAHLLMQGDSNVHGGAGVSHAGGVNQHALYKAEQAFLNAIAIDESLVHVRNDLGMAWHCLAPYTHNTRNTHTA